MLLGRPSQQHLRMVQLLIVVRALESVRVCAARACMAGRVQGARARAASALTSRTACNALLGSCTCHSDVRSEKQPRLHIADCGCLRCCQDYGFTMPSWDPASRRLRRPTCGECGDMGSAPSREAPAAHTVTPAEARSCKQTAHVASFRARHISRLTLRQFGVRFVPCCLVAYLSTLRYISEKTLHGG